MPDDDIGSMFDGFFDDPAPQAGLIESPSAAVATPVEALPHPDDVEVAVSPAAAPMHDMGLGFIFGSSGGLLGGGIASVKGDAAIKYKDLQSLLSAYPGIIFASLLPPSSAASGSPAQGRSLAPELYPTPASALSVELGARLSVGAADLATETSSSVCAISAVLGRADDFLSRFLGGKLDLGLKVPRADLVGEFVRDRLMSHYPVNTAGRENGDLEDRISSDAKGWAWQPIGTVGARNMHLRLQASRSWLMGRALELPAPSGDFTDVDPDMTSVADAVSTGAVCFAQVSLKSAKDALAGVFGKSFLPRGRSLWFGAHEIDAFAEYASLSIDRVVQSRPEENEGLAVGDVLSLERPAGAPLLSASISAGLAYEAILYGASSVEGAPHAGLLSAWVRSTLRGEMLREALRLKKVGFDVTDIGLTHVSISVPKSGLSRLRSYMLTGTNLMLPVGWSWSS